MKNSHSARALAAATALRDRCSALSFAGAVTHVYNPLEYAWPAHSTYLERFAAGKKRAIFLGMNPGPFGMAQTGVPFGEIAAVRDWLGINAEIGRPAQEHPKRRITGFACTQSEVSGRRLWGLFQERFKTPEAFFAEHFVANYCPLVFMNESGANITPDKLSPAERTSLAKPCDEHLTALVAALEPEWVIGVGAYAETQGKKLLAAFPDLKIGRILHPSPASPAANKGWAEEVLTTLQKYGVWN